jgi:hypothetical protein
MILKFLILAVCIALMLAVIVLAVAGLFWTLELPSPSTGGLVVLGISAAAAVLCLWRIWTTRHDHLRRPTSEGHPETRSNG